MSEFCTTFILQEGLLTTKGKKEECLFPEKKDGCLINYESSYKLVK